MQVYKNLEGRSAVKAFAYGDDFITVEFQDPSHSGATTYTYTYESAGQVHVEQMKTLAEEGIGLLSYIDRNVRKKYAQKR
jgi:hypothetical protein